MAKRLELCKRCVNRAAEQAYGCYTEKMDGLPGSPNHWASLEYLPSFLQQAWRAVAKLALRNRLVYEEPWEDNAAAALFAVWAETLLLNEAKYGLLRTERKAVWRAVACRLWTLLKDFNLLALESGAYDDLQDAAR